MSKDLKRRERELERLATAESNVRTRLNEMRVDALELVATLDRLTCQPPRLRALDNLVRFPKGFR
jgi:hypothetical protein